MSSNNRRQSLRRAAAAVVIAVLGVLVGPVGGAVADDVGQRNGADGGLHFVVSTDGTSWGAGAQGSVWIYGPDGSWYMDSLQPGSESTRSVPPGEYAVRFEFEQGTVPVNLAPPSSGYVTVRSGRTTEVDAVFRRGGTISGTLTAAVGDRQPSSIQAYEPDWPGGPNLVGHVMRGPGNTYQIIGLATGSYTISYEGGETGLGWFYGEWWRDARERDAERIAVTVGQDLVGYDVVLQPKNSIRGTLFARDANGGLVPAAGIRYVQTTPGTFAPKLQEGSYTRPDGGFEVYGMDDGVYSVIFFDENGEVYNGLPLATVVSPPYSVIGGEPVTDVQLVMEQSATISGSVYREGPAGLQSADVPVRVEAQRLNAYTGVFDTVDSIVTSDEYRLDHLPEGDYRIRFVDESELGLRSEYWDDALFSADATMVSVSTGGAATGVDATLEESVTYISQVAGADRYDTAAQVSKATFEPGLPVLYVASGENYPDALSAGPAAIHQGGGLLLVTRDGVPAATKAEIKRLQPKRIVVVGGPSAVSDAVVRELRTLRPDVLRIGGADRFEVSRRVAQYAFCGDPASGGTAGACEGGAGVVFVATGRNFPDALSAGPAAGKRGGPVVLVDGAAGGLDSATKKTLVRLGARDGYTLGGPAAITDGVQHDLDAALPGDVERLAGDDRFDVAIAIDREVFGTDVETQFIASGLSFADALSGGPAAAANGAPLILVQRDCLPNVAVDYLSDVNPVHLVMLGGPAALGAGVTELTYRCGP